MVLLDNIHLLRNEPNAEESTKSEDAQNGHLAPQKTKDEAVAEEIVETRPPAIGAVELHPKEAVPLPSEGLEDESSNKKKDWLNLSDRNWITLPSSSSSSVSFESSVFNVSVESIPTEKMMEISTTDDSSIDAKLSEVLPSSVQEEDPKDESAQLVKQEDTLDESFAVQTLKDVDLPLLEAQPETEEEPHHINSPEEELKTEPQNRHEIQEDSEQQMEAEEKKESQELGRETSLQEYVLEKETTTDIVELDMNASQTAHKRTSEENVMRFDLLQMDRQEKELNDLIQEASQFLSNSRRSLRDSLEGTEKNLALLQSSSEHSERDEETGKEAGERREDDNNMSAMMDSISNNSSFSPLSSPTRFERPTSPVELLQEDQITVQEEIANLQPGSKVDHIEEKNVLSDIHGTFSIWLLIELNIIAIRR